MEEALTANLSVSTPVLFGHDDMGTAAGNAGSTNSKRLDIVRILKEHGIAERKRNTIGEEARYVSIFLLGCWRASRAASNIYPSPRNHGVAGSDARQSVIGIP